MADNTIVNAIKFLKGEEKSLPAAKTEGQVYFAYKNVGTAEKPSYTGAIYIDTPIGGTQNRIKMTANADIADKAFNDSAGLSIRDTYLSSLGYTDDGKQTILIKGSGNNQTRIALPIASTTKSGIVTTDAQSFNGTKTFTTVNSTNLTVSGSNGFNYSGISAGAADVARPVWFADNSGYGKPVINTNFTYNPATQTLSVANLSGTADKANKDNAGNDIRSTYISNITINNDIMTITKGSGATSTLSIKDKLYSSATMATKEDLDKFIEANVFKFGHINAIEGYNGLEKNDGIILSGAWYSSANYGHQIYIDDSSYALRHRYRKSGNWSDWTSILDSTNYNSYAPTKTGGGASGNWGINISGNAASANKLNTNAGSATFPVYFSNGVPVQCDGTLANSISGNAATASKLQTTRTITLAGSVTGSAAFDGSNNITITTSTNHSHSQYLPLAGGTMGGTSFITWADSRNWDNNNKNVTFPVSRGGLQWYGQSDSVKLFSQETASDNLELVLQFEDDNSNGLSIRNSTGTQTARIAADGNITASSFIGNLSGNANTATALTSSAGSSTQPIYFSGGKPVACTYTLSKSVPADAKFTDTWRPLGTTGDTACAGNDSRLSNARPASDVYAWAKASSKPSYSWGEITGKPNTFTPSSHTHYSLSTIGDQRSTATTPDSYSNTFVFQGLKNNSTIGITSTNTYSYVLGLRGWKDPSGGDSHELAFNDNLGILTRSGATTWNAWRRILDSSNYTEYTVTKSGSGASGTWGINVTGSAGSVAWGNVTGKPSSFNPSSHTHPYLPLSGGTMTGTINLTATKLACNFRPNSSAYCTGIMHQTNGNEALVFAAANAVTSFIFKCGQDPIGMTSTTWANITPSMQIKQQSVYINSLIANNVTPGYNLYVNGSTRCNGTLGVGNGSSAEIDFFPNSSSTIGARIKAYNDRIEFVFS